jgi:predicted GIY-YIG superfamily endonuclease
MAGTFHQKNSSESNALSKRSASKGFSMPASAPADSSVLSQSKGFFVYILRCADGSFYAGHTSDVEDRVKLHNDARGAHWTACRRPVTLVYQEQCPSEAKAITRERQLKGWSHAKKLALINGDAAKLKSLAKRRVR